MAVLSTPRGRGIAGAVVATVVVLFAVAACGNPAPVFHDAAAAPGDSPTASPVVTESPSEPPSPAASPTAAPPPAKKAPPPKPKPVQVAAPPPTRPQGPPPRSPAPGAKCPTYYGPVAPRSDVAAAISAASGHAFRPTLSLNDPNPPPINVRLALIQATAWEESGWQSTIVACDGGVGTMQVMKDTADWMNTKYGTSYDFHTLTGNVMIGTGYLAWLVRYFGDRYFGGNYDLSGDKDKLVLLDLVISGYQAGYGAVDNAMAAGKGLPNTSYVYTVEPLITNQPWG